ncbi:hypothetical protein ILYODFUR_038257 [Ilyodon furcidens]|uniref:Uncharacterized protein n=1 Tax=Ilyodon furcidens TaxID=33524 RepID=A0ABV0T3Q0_9TELE
MYKNTFSYWKDFHLYKLRSKQDQCRRRHLLAPCHKIPLYHVLNDKNVKYVTHGYITEGNIQMRTLTSVSLHGDGRSSNAVVTFDLMDHEEGDEQAQQLEGQVDKQVVSEGDG